MKAKSIKRIESDAIVVEFEDGTCKLLQVKQLLAVHPIFSDLIRIKGLFMQAHIEAGGYGIVWNENIDIATEYIYEHGVDV